MSKKIKIHFVERFSEGDTDKQVEAMRLFFDFVSLEDCEYIYCASINSLNSVIIAKNISNKPVIVYCWDYYLWAHEGKSPWYEWAKYAELMQSAFLVIVPSSGQQKRLKELLGIDSVVIKTGIFVYEHKTKDCGYVLDPVRDYPEENLGWIQKACDELNIPYIHTEHGYSQEEFRKLVSECTFMTCAYREASTGGLTLMEGLWNGKRSLVSNSPYMGAKDYLGPFGEYFQYDSFEDLKKKIEEMWTNREEIDIKKARQYILTYFSFDQMAKGMYNTICEQKKS